MTKISVIIPALNEEEYIEHLLNDIRSQTYKPHEVVVVDGSSNDSTVSKVTIFPNVRMIQTRAQVAHQRHTGASKVTGDILVFLDADTRIKKDFLQNIQKIFSSSDIAFACPWYIPQQRHLPSMFLYTFFNTIFYSVQKLMPCGAGSCIIVRRSTYIASGGFEERFTMMICSFFQKQKSLENLLSSEKRSLSQIAGLKNLVF